MVHKMNDKNVKFKLIAGICLALVILQSLIIFIEELLFKFIRKTAFTRSVVVMIMMVIFTIVILLWSRHKSITLAIFPEKFSKFDIIAGIVTLLIYIFTP